jgi:hypothetical protein
MGILCCINQVGDISHTFLYTYIQSHLKIFFKIYYIFINPKLSPIQLLNFLMFVAQKSPPPKLQNKVFLLFSTNSNLGQVYKLTLLYCIGACMTSRLLIMQQPFARSAAGYLIAYQSFTDVTQSKNLESSFKSWFPSKRLVPVLLYCLPLSRINNIKGTANTRLRLTNIVYVVE